MAQLAWSSNIRYSIASRRIILDGEIHGVKEVGGTAAVFKQALQRIIRDDKKEPVVFFINSEGGDMDAAFTIYDLLSQSATPIYTIAFGKAQSAAFVVTQGGLFRFAAYGTVFEFHQCERTYFGERMNADTLLEEWEELKEIDEQQQKIFCTRGYPVKKISDLFVHDEALSVKGALRLKLIDKAIRPSSIKEMHQRVLKHIARIKV